MIRNTRFWSKKGKRSGESFRGGIKSPFPVTIRGCSTTLRVRYENPSEAELREPGCRGSPGRADPRSSRAGSREMIYCVFCLRRFPPNPETNPRISPKGETPPRLCGGRLCSRRRRGAGARSAPADRGRRGFRGDGLAVFSRCSEPGNRIYFLFYFFYFLFFFTPKPLAWRGRNPLAPLALGPDLMKFYR